MIRPLRLSMALLGDVEGVRTAYRERFDQASVLRVDTRAAIDL